MTRKIISFLLFMCLILSLTSCKKEKTYEILEYTGAVWDERPTNDYNFFENCTFYGNVKYDPNTQTVTVSGKGRVKNIYEYYSVDGWYKQTKVIKKIIFEEGVTEIYDCFAGMTALETIEFPKSLKTISNSFEGATSLKKVVFPENVEEIRLNSFNFSGLSDITFKGSAIYIGSNSFCYLNNLETILIPEGSVCDESFRGCPNLKEVILEKNVDLIEENHYLHGPDEDDPFVDNPIVSRDYNFTKDDSSFPKAYLYLPNDGESQPWGEGGKYKPIIVPEGKDWKDYRDVPMALREE